MKELLPVDLYHGTSTVFLDSIVKNGLGGVNPVIEWKLLELSNEVYRLSKSYLNDTELFQVSSATFKKMTEQSNKGNFNWQHGDTYLSVARQTATRYAISKQYGSELLTYTINFLKKLIELKVEYVLGELYQKHHKIYGLLESNPSPLLIQVRNISTVSLLDEHGNDCASNISQINEMLSLEPDKIQLHLQQCNFRLKYPVSIDDLAFWFVNVQEWNPYSPKYSLYEIKVDQS